LATAIGASEEEQRHPTGGAAAAGRVRGAAGNVEERARVVSARQHERSDASPRGWHVFPTLPSAFRLEPTLQPHIHIDTCLPACSYRMHIGTVRTLCTDEAKGKGKKDKKGQRQKRKKKTKKKEDGTRGKENKDKGERKCQSGPVRKRGRAGGRRASHFLFADSYVLIMYAMPCHAMPCHAVPCNAMQCTGVDSPPPPFSPRVLIRPKLGRRRPLNASTER